MTESVRWSDRNFARGFFSDEKSDWAMQQVAMAGRLTLFVGAGVSMDQGIDGWGALVRKALERKLRESRLMIAAPARTEADVAAFAKGLVNASFQLPAATMVDQMYDDDFVRVTRRAVRERKSVAARNNTLRELIYGPLDNQRVFAARPSLAREVLLLAAAVKALDPTNDLHIVSTNYDDLLNEIVHNRHDLEFQKAVRDAKVRFRVYQDERPGQSSDTEIPIVHIHGRIPRKGSPSRLVVFSERDYVTWMSDSGFRPYIQDRMGHETTLMIGTSLRDYNLIQYLSTTNYHEPRLCRIAILPVQGDPSFDLFGPDDFERLSKIRDGRGRQLGISMLVPDFHGQVLQFVKEARYSAVQRTTGAEYLPYLRRMANWWRDFSTLRYRDDNVRRDRTLWLQDKAAGLNGYLFDSVEHCKLEVWIRPDFDWLDDAVDVHDERCFELWINSQSMWLSGSGYRPHRVGITQRTTHPAIRTFATRSVAYGLVTDRMDGRWVYYVAVPVVLGEKYADVPVGSVVLLIAARPGMSVNELKSAITNEDELTRALTEIGVDALRPT